MVCLGGCVQEEDVFLPRLACRRTPKGDAVQGPVTNYVRQSPDAALELVSPCDREGTAPCPELALETTGRAMPALACGAAIQRSREPAH